MALGRMVFFIPYDGKIKRLRPVEKLYRKQEGLV